MCGKKNDFEVIGKMKRIVGGTESTIYEYPWQALVRGLSLYNKKKCGGTLISDQWILTAAQCVDGLDNIILCIRII